MRPWLRGTVAGRRVTVYRRVGPGMDEHDRGICAKVAGRYVISVHPDLEGERLAEVLLHELLHAADWDKGEEWIAETGADLARMLVQAGLITPRPSGPGC